MHSPFLLPGPLPLTWLPAQSVWPTCKPFHAHPVTSSRSLFPFPGKETRLFPRGQDPPDQGHSVQGAPWCPGISALGSPVSPDGPLSISKQGHTSGDSFYRAVSLYNLDFALFMGCVFSEKKKVSAVSLQPRAKYGGGGGGDAIVS